jgi:hypothetical protein
MRSVNEVVGQILGMGRDGRGFGRAEPRRGDELLSGVAEALEGVVRVFLLRGGFGVEV